MAERATARITAFSPGQSPPAVRTPMRIGPSLGSLPVGRLAASWIALLALLGAVIGVGCGEGGAASGATVKVYAAAGLCGRAEQQLVREGGRAGDLKVQLICLSRVASRRGRASLAAAGANAREATEDSTAIAYLESAGPSAKFTQAIVEA